MADKWGGSWGTSWGSSWGAGTTTTGGVRSLLAFWMGGACAPSGVVPPVVIDTGGSGHKGSGRRRNLNDDPDAFAEMLREWREKKAGPALKSPEILKPTPKIPEATSEPLLLEELRQSEATYDRAMAAYEAALVKLEQVKTAKAKRAAILREEQARQQAMQLAIDWELARIAYEDFLDDEDDVMLLTT